MAPLLSIATYLVLGPFDQGASSPSLRLVILADVVYVLLLAALVLHRIIGIVAARRAQSAGARLHLRLTGVFALLALLPTVLPIFAGRLFLIRLWWQNQAMRCCKLMPYLA